MLPAQPNQSLINGLACLQALAASSTPVGCSQLARDLGLSITQVNRLLKTLHHLGFIRQNSKNKYGMGASIHILAAQSLSGSGLLKAALKPLEGLSKHRCIVALGVLWQDQVTYFYHRRPGLTATEAISGFGLFPATCSSIGMVLLAACDPKNVRRLYKGKEIPGYPGGIKDLLWALRETARRGYGSVTDPDTGISLAVPVGRPFIGAVALSGKMPEETVAGKVDHLKNAAKTISDKLQNY